MDKNDLIIINAKKSFNFVISEKEMSKLITNYAKNNRLQETTQTYTKGVIENHCYQLIINTRNT